MSAIKKKLTAVFLFQLLQFDYEVWEIIIYFTTCFSFWSLFYTDFLQSLKNLERSWTVGQTGRIFFLLKTTQIWVITIVVVLVQSTVIFQKGWGSGYLHYWLVMEIENLLGWDHTLQIHNQLLKHNIATILISIPHKL
jgi:hypothetical protein